MDMLKLVAAAWFGACLRNENDRKKTLEFFNSIGLETEIILALYRSADDQERQLIRESYERTLEQFK